MKVDVNFNHGYFLRFHNFRKFAKCRIQFKIKIKNADTGIYYRRDKMDVLPHPTYSF